MSELRVNTIKSATVGGNITIGDATNSAFAVLPATTMVGGGRTTQTFGYALTDETDALTGTVTSTFRLPHNFTIEEISVGLTEAHDTDITVNFSSGGEGRAAAITTAEGLFETTNITDWVLDTDDRIVTTSTITGDDGVGLKVYLTGFARLESIT